MVTRGPSARTAVLALSVLGLTAVVLASAGTGPADWDPPDVLGLNWREGRQPSPLPFTAPPAPTGVPTGSQATGPSSLWQILLTVLAVAAATLIVVVYVRSRAARVDPDEPPPEPPPDPTPEAMAAGARRAAAHLEGEGADAVVRAWLELERSAAEAGVERDPALTPTEFTVEVLTRLHADPAAVDTLLRLYHRARFGHLPTGPPDVAAARAALARLEAGWGA